MHLTRRNEKDRARFDGVLLEVVDLGTAARLDPENLEVIVPMKQQALLRLDAVSEISEMNFRRAELALDFGTETDKWESPRLETCTLNDWTSSVVRRVATSAKRLTA